MHPEVEQVLHHGPGDHPVLAERVAALSDETLLWELMSAYNWDEGFTVPLAVVRHPRCDRALALRMFWELDDTARLHLSDEAGALREAYSVEARHQPEEFAVLVAYCTTLVEGLRHGTFPVARNSFDTGYHALDDPGLSDRQRTLRAARTRRARQEFEDAFLHPVVAHPPGPGDR
ncbi:DUF4274 domain-containing protein [Streptomyces sp. NPDC005438]|uniref:DUF4274 domain-containing protein n=1 Tax=Streptomyces sp. NPDC005438 TaxID=3156880 RepID=UPI0033B754D6